MYTLRNKFKLCYCSSSGTTIKQFTLAPRAISTGHRARLLNQSSALHSDRPFIPIGPSFRSDYSSRGFRTPGKHDALVRLFSRQDKKRSGFALLLPMRKGRKGKEVVSRAFCSRQERSKKLRFTLLLPTSKGRKEGRKEEVSRSPFCRKEGRRGSISRSFFPRGEEE
ncbi:unnamed protein product [Ectocarpus fasciculatus]